MKMNKFWDSYRSKYVTTGARPYQDILKTIAQSNRWDRPRGSTSLAGQWRHNTIGRYKYDLRIL